MRKNLPLRPLLGFLIAALCPATAAMAQTSKPQLTNLPTLYIETFDNKAITSKENYIYSALTYVDGDESTLYDSVSIRGRGNSTWGLAKKPYRIKFKEKERFLGKQHAKAKSWTLLANYADKTLLRNAVTTEMGIFMGMDFNPAAQFVDLYLNGNYRGNYQISDQVEVRKKRVDVEEQDYPLASDADISGGYLLEVDGFATSEPVYFRTSKNLLVTVKYPDEDEIATSQRQYIANHVQKFEDALFSDDFKDPTTGYRAYVDSASLINWYVATEYTGNVDGFWSTYISKKRGDDHLYFGPMWDHDIAYNNCNRVGDVSQQLMLNAGFGTDLTKVWVKRMWEDPWFANAVNDRWKQLVAAGIEDHLCNYIDSMAVVLDESQAQNFSKWAINRRAYNEIVLFSTYQEGIDYLKKFIRDHTAYLTTTFASMAAAGTAPEEQKSVAFHADPTYYYRIANKGSVKLLSVADQSTAVGAGLIIESPISGRECQQWAIDSVAGQYVSIVNMASGLAMTDDAVQSGSTYATGSQLSLRKLDKNNARQLWYVCPVSTGNLYALINKQTGLAINNSSGSVTDGNPVISYTSDSRNETSANRQWYVEKTEPRSVETGIDAPAATQGYAIYYNRENQTIRFGLERMDGGVPDTQVSLFTAGGQRLFTFSSTETQSVAHLPAGVYMLSWNDGTGVRSVKFAK